MNLRCKAIYYMKDFKSFETIQISKYCSTKKSNNISTPEMDVISDLIKEYWCDLLASGHLNSKTVKEKTQIFKSVTILFPYTAIPENWIDGISYADFQSYQK